MVELGVGVPPCFVELGEGGDEVFGLLRHGGGEAVALGDVLYVFEDEDGMGFVVGAVEAGGGWDSDFF